MTLALALILLGVAFAAAAYPLYRAQVGQGGTPREASELEERRERREATLAALHDVEFDYRLGKLSEEDYQTLRAQLRAQAVAALKKYDEHLSALEDQIENEVRALRRHQPASGKAECGELVCANCARVANAEDVFCARCGARLPERAQARTPKALAALHPQPSRGKALRAQVPLSAVPRGWLIGAGVFAAGWIALAAFLYFSAAGQARAQTPIGSLPTTEIHSLAISPLDPNVIFFAHHTGMMQSTDGGHSWIPLDVSGDAMALAVSRAAPQRIFVAGHNLFARSDDNGKTWRRVENDLPNQDIHALAALPNSADVLYTVVAGQGLFLSEDAGARWQRITQELPKDVSTLAVLPGTPDQFFVGTQGGGMWRSVDGGATWESANSIVGGALRGGEVNALAFDFTTGTLYAGTEEGLSFTQNVGSGWIRRNLDSVVAALAVSEDGLTIVIVNAQGQVFRSTDRGVTWGGR